MRINILAVLRHKNLSKEDFLRKTDEKRLRFKRENLVFSN